MNKSFMLMIVVMTMLLFYVFHEQAHKYYEEYHAKEMRENQGSIHGGFVQTSQ